MLNRQVEDTKLMLMDKWYGQIQQIFVRGTKRKLIPNASKPRMLKRFYDTVAALMTHQLQDLCIRSLHGYTNFLCDITVSQLVISCIIYLFI